MPSRKPKPRQPRPAHEGLAELSRRSGLSLRALGERSGVPFTNLGAIFRGQSPGVTAETVRKILEGLGKTWSDLDIQQEEQG